MSLTEQVRLNELLNELLYFIESFIEKGSTFNWKFSERITFELCTNDNGSEKKVFIWHTSNYCKVAVSESEDRFILTKDYSG